MYINDKWNSIGEGIRNNTGNENDDEEDVWFPVIVYILFALFGIVLIKQNIYLIIAFRKREFYELNMYYSIVHWSIANIFHSILPIYMSFVPKTYRNETMTLAFLAAHSIVSAFALNIAVCFVFDKFINSKDFCRRMIRTTWLIFIVCLAIVLSLVCTNILKESWIAYVYIAYSSIALLIFIVRLVYFCSKGSEEETFRLRVLMSGVFVVSSFLFTISWITNIIDSDLELAILVLSLFMIVCDGFINVFLVYRFEMRFRPIFSHLITRCLLPCRKRQESEAPPTHEDNERPSNNEEVAREPGNQRQLHFLN